MNDTTPPKKERRWLRVLLICSLALNLAVVGAVAGLAFRAKDRWGGKEPMPPSLAVLIFRELDRDTRHDILRAASGQHSDFRAQRKADRQALFATLQAKPFVADDVASVLERNAGQQFEFRRTIRAAWLERVQNMTDAERDALVERLKARAHHSHPKHGARKD